jgi:hypothetical protein
MAQVGVVGGLLSRSAVPRKAYVIAAVFLVLAAMILWIWARVNLKRETKLQFSAEFSRYQIEQLLGLHQQIEPAESWLLGTPFIFSQKYRDPTFGTGPLKAPVDLDAWLEAKTKKSGFRGMVDLLFGGFLAIGVLIAIDLLFLAPK